MNDLLISQPIALDVSATNPEFRESHVTRGIGRYVANLQRELAALPDSNKYLGQFDHCELLKNSRVSKWINFLPCGRVTARQQILYPFVLNSDYFSKVKYLHFPAHMDAAAWGMKPYILTVLDLIPLILKDLYAPEVFNWRFRLARFLELRAIHSAKHLIAISQTTADDLTRLLGISPEKITVTPLGVDEKFFTLGQQSGAAPEKNQLFLDRWKIPANRSLLLYVGGIDARKNISQLLKLVKALGERAEVQGRSKPVLILAGSIQNDKNFPALEKQILNMGIEADVVTTGYLTDTDLLELYRQADLFCFLSLYEGFGLPPLEAMAAGLPVLSSNRSCLPEILGDAACLVDPEDLSTLVVKAEALLVDQALRGQYRSLGIQQARRFTWKNTAELTLQVYKKLLAETN